MNLIRNIVEPDRLLMVWQRPDPKQRRRYVVGEIVRKEDEVCLTYLPDSSDYKEAVSYGFNHYPAFKGDDSVHCVGVMQALMRRLPPRSREDFGDYLLRHRIDPKIVLSDMALIGYTGARLPSDGFSFIHPFDGAPVPCELLVEVAGYRFHGQQLECGQDDDLSLNYEPSNKQDKNAIAFQCHGERIGYVPRPLTPAFSRWLEKASVSAQIERFNGTTDVPRVYAFVSITR